MCSPNFGLLYLEISLRSCDFLPTTGSTQVVDQADDPLENSWPILLDISHELFDLFILGSIDDEFVGLFKVDVDFLSEVSV